VRIKVFRDLDLPSLPYTNVDLGHAVITPFLFQSSSFRQHVKALPCTPSSPPRLLITSRRSPVPPSFSASPYFVFFTLMESLTSPLLSFWTPPPIGASLLSLSSPFSSLHLYAMVCLASTVLACNSLTRPRYPPHAVVLPAACFSAWPGVLLLSFSLVY
jgi:hypothetical protein